MARADEDDARGVSQDADDAGRPIDCFVRGALVAARLLKDVVPYRTGFVELVYGRGAAG